MKNFYLDIDTAYVAVGQYLSRVCEVHGIRSRNRDDAAGIVNNLLNVLCLHYKEIPKVAGAEECLNIIRTEYDVVFVSKIRDGANEISSKTMFAVSEDAHIEFYYDSVAEIDMSGGVFLSADSCTLGESNAENKYLLYGKYNYGESVNAGSAVFDWHSLLDIMVRGDEDEELREYFCSRMSPLFFGKRGERHI